jgi:hypothetical protein
MTGLLTLLGFFAVIGAAMAFLVDYEEMSHHFAARRAVLREALRTSLITVLFLGCLITVILVVIAHSS